MTDTERLAALLAEIAAQAEAANLSAEVAAARADQLSMTSATRATAAQREAAFCYREQAHLLRDLLAFAAALHAETRTGS